MSTGNLEQRCPHSQVSSQGGFDHVVARVGLPILADFLKFMVLVGGRSRAQLRCRGAGPLSLCLKSHVRTGKMENFVGQRSETRAERSKRGRLGTARSPNL